jgi:hypothetical protein
MQARNVGDREEARVMRKQALIGTLAGALLAASPLAAEPIEELQLRLASLRNEQPARIEVDVELMHRGSAPLHLNKNRRRGTAIVTYGSRGVVSLEQRSRGSRSLFSFWKDRNEETYIPLLAEMEAYELADPAGMMEFLLSEATLLSDENVIWKGRPARLLVIHPARLPLDREDEPASAESDQIPLAVEMRIWLDESGDPLAMERSMEFRLGQVLSATESQSFTFQQVGGRLLVDEAQETSSAAALAVLRGKDTKTMKVVSVDFD